jgi:hypothetical protein
MVKRQQLLPLLRPKSLQLPIFAASLLSVAALPVCAQTASVAPSTQSTLLGTTSATLAISDVFVGRNVVGPYLLSWKGIEVGSEIVSRGPQRLQANTDYKLDPATGALTFTRSLRAQEIARVDYWYAPSKATANTGTTFQPMKFNLFDFANGALNFNALIRPDVPGAAGTTTGGSHGLMLLGFGSSMNLTPQSTLASKLFLDMQGGNFKEKSGLQLSEKTKTNFGQFSAGFTRGGSQFKAGDDTGIIAGRQLLEAAGSLNAIHGITASATFQQTSELPDQGKGSVVTVLGQKLAGTLGAKTRFLATRTETTINAADGTTANRVANRIQLDQKVDGKTQATFLLDQNQNKTGDTSTLLQTSTLSVRSQPTDAVSVTGSYQNKLQTTGPEDTTNVKVEAAATKKLKLSALIGDRFNKTSALHSRQAGVEYAAMPNFTVSGSVQVRAEAGTESLATGFTAAAKPVKFVEVSGGVKLRDTTIQGVPDPTAPDTYDLKLSVGLPNNKIKLTGGYTNNPEDERGTVTRAYNRSVGLQTTLGQFDLAGGYSFQNEYLTTKISTILDLKFGWRVAKTTQFTTSFREAATQDQGLLATDTYTLALTHKIGSLLDFALSGTMTNYLKDGLPQPNQDYRAEAKLGLHF